MCERQFDIETLVRRGANVTFSREYNCNLRVLFLWWVLVVVDPGCVVDPHEHDEEEAFIAISGRARISVDGQRTEIRAGDVAYIPRFAHHEISNPSDTEPFVMIDLYWDNRASASA
jgi:mannose-6-phosphate isomerase-like protein (cupin superfamily)